MVLNNFTDGRVKISIKDELGRLVYENEEPAQFEYRINTAGFRSGLFIAEVYQGTEVKRIKILKTE